jgi:glyoxylase-like metal-dependent hydrolase (beta-lactamase superfamily II)
VPTVHPLGASVCTVLLVASQIAIAPHVRAQSTSPAAPALPDSGFAVRRLADGVYAAIRREPPGVINESNSLFVVGRDAVLVVDAQSSSARTREVVAALRRITTKPVRWLVNTHWHDDHVAGNAVWRDAYPGLEIVAHATAAEDMATEGARLRKLSVGARDNTIGFLRQLVADGRSYLGGAMDEEERLSHLASARLLEDYSDASADLRPLPATRTVADRLALDVGGTPVEVLYLGRGHTRGDLVVHLPREHVVAAGDLVMWPVEFVGSTSYPLDFGDTVDRLRALHATRIVPGHGPVLEGDAHAALVSRLLHSLASQARAAAARGDSLPQAMRAIDLGDVRAARAGESSVRRILFSYYVTQEGIKRALAQAREERDRR